MDTFRAAMLSLGVILPFVRVISLEPSPAEAMARQVSQEPGAKTMNTKNSGTSPAASPLEWHGQSCAQSEPSVRIIQDSGSWGDLWKRSLNGPPPPVDFKKHFAVAVFLGSKNTGGYGVQFLEPISDSTRMRIRYAVGAPRRGSFVIQAFTQPYAIQLFPSTPLKVQVAEER